VALKRIWLATASDKVYLLLAHGRWFSPGTPASSTTKTGRHDIAEILLKVALKHQKSNQNQMYNRIIASSQNMVVLGNWCLSSASTNFQHVVTIKPQGGMTYETNRWNTVLWYIEKKPEYPERTTDHGQVTGKLYHLRLRVKYALNYLNYLPFPKYLIVVLFCCL
jgi:hypothetical protein